MKSNYLAYLNHYDIRPCTAQYLWLYMLLLNKLPDSVFILNKDYINPDRNRIEFTQLHRFPYIKEIPETLYPKNGIILNKVEDVIIDERIPSKILNKVVSEVIPEYESNLRKVIESNNLKGALTWVNNKTLEEVFKEYNLPVIHNESGALRAPFFNDTIYFDFKGVNGNTSFKERFEEFKKVSKQFPIYNRKELLQLSSPHKYKELIELSNKKPEYECGVALQVDVDTNMMVYNKGINSTDMLNLAVKEFHKVLVRNHPLSSIGYNSNISIGNCTLDNSKNSLEFISKCKNIWCINSSVGFEALLLGKNVKFFGDTPFKWITYMNEEDKLLALNFAVFNYLVPSQLVFNEDYYDYRVKVKGDEEEIYYQFKKNHWLK